MKMCLIFLQLLSVGTVCKALILVVNATATAMVVVVNIFVARNGSSIDSAIICSAGSGRPAPRALQIAHGCTTRAIPQCNGLAWCGDTFTPDLSWCARLLSLTHRGAELQSVVVVPKGGYTTAE